MKRWAPFLFSYGFATAATAGVLAGGPWIVAAFASAFVLHPALDRLLGRQEGEAPLEGSRIFDVMVWLAPLWLTGALAIILHRVTTAPYAGLEFWAAAHATGILSAGIGINVGHELIHRRRAWERGLGVWLYALVNYSHFRIEHVFGHHSNVAIPEDPATARRRESVYAFWLRSVLGQLASATRYENRRLAGLPWMERALRHRMIHYALIATALSAWVGLAFGGWGVAFFWAQGIVAALFLETINYVEHYGLTRARRENGRYEPVTPMHSWDTDYRLTNWTLFNLGKHARHHASPSIPYHRLTATPGAPRLPFGYSTMALMAFFPPLYMKVMERELAAREAPVPVAPPAPFVVGA